MSTDTRSASARSMEARFAATGRRIDQVATRAQDAGDDVRTAVARRVDALRAKEATARAKAHAAAESELQAWDEVFMEIDHELDMIDTEIAIAVAQLAVDIAEDDAAFEAAVAQRIDAYNAHIERLQAKVARADGEMRDTLEAGVQAVRDRKAVAVQRLTEYRAAAGKAAQSLEASVQKALADLDRAAEEAASKFE